MRLIVFHYDFFQVGFDTRCSPWLAVWRYLKKSAVPINNRFLIQPRANRDHMLESFFCLRRHRDRSHPLLCFGGFDEQFPGVIDQLMLHSHNISLEIHVIHGQPAEFTYEQTGLMKYYYLIEMLCQSSDIAAKVDQSFVLFLSQDRLFYFFFRDPN